jgi:methylenetetrahydrofolate--tRNA-(uracil-5-)-methyltransferase
LANAEWLRLGVMHRNTFIDAPRLLDARLQLRSRPGLYFAGQITGAEGYVEAAACGAMAGIAAAYAVRGETAPDVPTDTALGAVVAHLQNTASPDFQPANVTWTWFSALPGRPIREKRLRRAALAARALERIDAFAKAVAVTPSRESALATAGAPAE